MANCSYCNGTGHTTIQNSSGVAEFGSICKVCGGSGLEPGTRYVPSINDHSAVSNQTEIHRVAETTSHSADSKFSFIVGILAGICLFLFFRYEIKDLFLGSDASGFYIPVMAVIIIGPLLLARFVPHAAKVMTLILAGAAILFLLRMLI